MRSILAAAPYVEGLQSAPLAQRALAGVSAAVVGVIANLAAYLGVAAMAPEIPSSLGAGPLGLDWTRLAIAAVAAVLAFGAKMAIQWLVLLGAAAGLLLGLAGVL